MFEGPGSSIPLRCCIAQAVFFVEAEQLGHFGVKKRKMKDFLVHLLGHLAHGF